MDRRLSGGGPLLLSYEEDLSYDPGAHIKWPQTLVSIASKDYTPSLCLHGNLYTCDIHIHAEKEVKGYRDRKEEQ